MVLWYYLAFVRKNVIQYGAKKSNYCPKMELSSSFAQYFIQLEDGALLLLYTICLNSVFT